MTARTSFAPALAALLLVATLVAAPAFAAGGQLEPFPDLDFGQLVSDPLGALASSKFLHLLIFFVILVPISNAVLFKPLIAMLDEREAQIQGASTEADEVAARADDVFGRYQDAVTRARRDAEDLRRETLDAARKGQAAVTAEARADAEREVAKVRLQVATSTDHARAALRSDGDALARTVAEQVLGRAL